jgi:hypothetical protein
MELVWEPSILLLDEVRRVKKTIASERSAKMV